jgi:hypothetical protein
MVGSPEHRASRRAALKNTAQAADKAFALLDYGNCAVQKVRNDVTGLGDPSSLMGRVNEQSTAVITACMPIVIDGVLDQIKAKVSEKVALAGTVAGELQDVVSIGLSGIAVGSTQFGGPNYTHGEVDLHRADSVAPTWLYQSFLGTNAIGPSGIQRAATIDGRNYPNSTGFWVGCEGRPAVTQFSLDGKYSLVDTTLGLDSGTPQSLSVTITLAADGVPLDSWTLRPGQSVPVSGSVAGRMVLSLSAQAVSGTCGSSALGYGIAGDARLS